MSEQFDSSRPIYAQLVERLKARILAGTSPARRAPGLGAGPCRSRRGQSQHHAAGPGPAGNRGLVRTERTAGRYVTEDTELIEQLRTEAARKLAEEFLVKMRGIGYSPARAAALLEQLDTTKEDAQ